MDLDDWRVSAVVCLVALSAGVLIFAAAFIARSPGSEALRMLAAALFLIYGMLSGYRAASRYRGQR